MATRQLGYRVLIVSAVMAASVPVAPAAAQNMFDFFFHDQRRASPPPSANAYSDPLPQFGLFERRPRERQRRTPSVSGIAYCVRLCDGRYFPIQRSGGADPAQLCNSFCPASKTKIFSGSAIDHAVARDGTRYGDLDNAFVYRTRIVADCTCNGKDSFGLVTTTAADDPTLRTGDIVATNDGFVAYAGGRRRNADFTPVESFSGLSARVREQLAGVKITPRNASVFPPQTLHAFDDRRAEADK